MQTKTNNYITKKKVYPKTMKGCFSFEEFQYLLNEKIKLYYEMAEPIDGKVQ